LLAVWFNFLCF